MDQERWLDLQQWLSRLPRQVIDTHPGLVLAEAWLLHHRAARATCPSVWRAPRRSCSRCPWVRRRACVFRVKLTRTPARWSSGRQTPSARSPWPDALLAVTPIEHSYVRALARLFAAVALQMRGDSRGAIATLDEGLREDRFGSHTNAPRLLTSYCFIYWMVADLPHLLQTADHLLELARERDLSESLDWAQHFRGCAHYQQNDLEAAARDFSAVVSEHTAAHGFTFLHQRVRAGVDAPGSGQGRTGARRRCDGG